MYLGLALVLLWASGAAGQQVDCSKVVGCNATSPCLGKVKGKPGCVAVASNKKCPPLSKPCKPSCYDACVKKGVTPKECKEKHCATASTGTCYGTCMKKKGSKPADCQSQCAVELCYAACIKRGAKPKTCKKTHCTKAAVAARSKPRCQVAVSCGSACPNICGQPAKTCVTKCVKGVVQCANGFWLDQAGGCCVPQALCGKKACSALRCGGGAKSPLPTTQPSEQNDDDSSLAVVIVIVAGVIGMTAIVSITFIKSKSVKNAASAATAVVVHGTVHLDGAVPADVVAPRGASLQFSTETNPTMPTVAGPSCRASTPSRQADPFSTDKASQPGGAAHPGGRADQAP